MKRTIFQDLDGCLADFEAGVIQFTGYSIGELPQSKMWAMIGNPIIKVDSPADQILKALEYDQMAPTSDECRKAWSKLRRNGLVDKNDQITLLGLEARKSLKNFKPYQVERDFYNSLDWMPDGRVLWNFVKNYDPYILTGLPMGNWAAPQKWRWCKRELGLGKERVLVGFARDKAKKAAEALGRPLNGDILIDDREKARASWVANGGYFILHTSANNTIAQLKGLGF